MLRYRQLPPYELFYILYVFTLIGRGKGYRVAFMACAPRSPYTMNVILRILGKVVVYYDLYTDNVYPAGGYICSNKYSIPAGLKTI
jgi:hypothetical protein